MEISLKTQEIANTDWWNLRENVQKSRAMSDDNIIGKTVMTVFCIMIASLLGKICESSVNAEYKWANI